METRTHLEPIKLLSGLHYQRNHKPKACSNPKVLIFHCCCSVTKSCTALCNYMDYSTAGSPVRHYLPELAQTQFSSVSQLCPTLCDPMDCSTPGFPVHHPLPELLKLMSIWSSVVHLLFCHTHFLLPSIFPSIRVFSNESVLHIRWPKYWSFSFSISPSNEYSGLISFRMDCMDLLIVQGTLKSLLQHHSSKASIL